MLFVVSLQTFGLNAAAKHLQDSRTAGQQDWSGPASSDLSLEAEREAVTCAGSVTLET